MFRQQMNGIKSLALWGKTVHSKLHYDKFFLKTWSIYHTKKYKKACSILNRSNLGMFLSNKLTGIQQNNFAYNRQYWKTLTKTYGKVE